MRALSRKLKARGFCGSCGLTFVLEQRVRLGQFPRVVDGNGECRSACRSASFHAGMGVCGVSFACSRRIYQFSRDLRIVP